MTALKEVVAKRKPGAVEGSQQSASLNNALSSLSLQASWMISWGLSASGANGR